MNLHSKAPWPAGALSNFAPHPFAIDGVQCASMEGFLQSLKFPSVDVQVEVCGLVGSRAKNRGAETDWQQRQVLHWQGEPIDRDSDAYQELLDRAFEALAEDDGFREALLATGDEPLTHERGRRRTSETVLTAREFTSRLTRLRDDLLASRLQAHRLTSSVDPG